jgi:hypothetical protein
MKCRNYTNYDCYSKESWTHLQVSFESLFGLTRRLSIVMARNFEVMLGQMLNRSVQNSVTLSDVISL